MLLLPGQVLTSSFTRKAALKIGAREEVVVVQLTEEMGGGQVVLEQHRSAVEVAKLWRQGDKEMRQFLTAHLSSSTSSSPP